MAAAGLLVAGADLVLDGSRGPALALAAGYGATGTWLLFSPREPLPNAGAAAVGASVGLFWIFLFLGQGSFSANRPGLVVACSTVTWGALALWGPARGHGGLVAAALAGAWLTVAVRLALDAVVATPEVAVRSAPDDASVAVGLASLLFGAAYVAAAEALDRSGLAGTATSFLAVGLAAVGTGAVHTTAGRTVAVLGAVLVVTGTGVGVVGGRLGRRLSTWAGATAVVVGAGLVAVDVAGESPLARGLTAMGAGTALVAAAALLGRRRNARTG